MAKKAAESQVPATQVNTAALKAHGVEEALPAHLQKAPNEVVGVEMLTQFIRPPRVKIVQKMAQPPVSEHFATGDVIIMPNMMRLAKMEYGADHKPLEEGPSLKFVPLFFFPEWIAWNPIEWKGSQPAVHERTTDPRSIIAARSKDPNQRAEKVGVVDGKDIYRKFCEHLNFVVRFIGSDELPDEPCVLSFSRAQHKLGANFARIIHQRKADIFGCVFEGFAKWEKNAKGDWYGFTVQNPADGGAWVTDQAAYENYKQANLELREAHQAGLIDIDHNDEDLDDEAAGNPANSTKY